MKCSPVFLLIGLLTIVIVTFFIVSNDDTFNNSLACSNLEYFKKVEINNIFIRKYIDGENHNAPTMVLGHNGRMVLPLDTCAFYNFATPGDSIVKDMQTDTVRVYREGQVYSFKIYFGCNDQ